MYGCRGAPQMAAQRAIRNPYGDLIMEELIKGLVTKVGLSEDKAKEVATFLQSNAAQVPKWLASSGVADKLPGGVADKLGGFLGGKK